MKQSQEIPAHIQQACNFFKQTVWSRLLDLLYTKYMQYGRIAGQVTLNSCTIEEQRAIASFLRKRLSSQRDIIVRLADFQKALGESSFACQLPDLLLHLFPERPHTPRPGLRSQRMEAQQQFYEQLTALASLNDTRGDRWLLEGEHGIQYLLRNYKNEAPHIRREVLGQVRAIISALNQLPVPPAYERLAQFAQRIGGDPHLLDSKTPTGRLFRYALTDLSRESSTRSIETISENESNPTTREAASALHHLYYEAGLLLDTISSTAIVFHLSHAEYDTGQSDPLLASAGERILILPLRQIVAWKKVTAASNQIYLFENPQVFEAVIDALLQNNKPADRVMPTLICTSGWPSVAITHLLNLLIVSSPTTTFHYSGDFDVSGLRIAAYLLAHYPTHCHLWHFDPPSYKAALHNMGTPFTQDDLNKLDALPNLFRELTATMELHGHKAYQEGVIELLIEEISNL